MKLMKRQKTSHSISQQTVEQLMPSQLQTVQLQPKLSQVNRQQMLSGIYMITGIVTKFDPMGYPYQQVEFSDSTASVNISFFDNDEVLAAIPPFSWVRVVASYESNHGFHQFRGQSLTRVDYLPYQEVNVHMIPYKYSANLLHLSQLVQLVESIQNETIKQTVASVLLQANVAIPFITCPASINYHHNYKGGLLEHSLDVAIIMLDERKLTVRERDLAIAIALFHDIGKTMTMTADITRTALGTLVDHSDLNLEVCGPALRQLSMSNNIAANEIRHAITCSSENSRFGFAAKTQLAKLLRRADGLSARCDGDYRRIS